jgi:hypothetical protein
VILVSKGGANVKNFLTRCAIPCISNLSFFSVHLHLYILSWKNEKAHSQYFNDPEPGQWIDFHYHGYAKSHGMGSWINIPCSGF